MTAGKGAYGGRRVLEGTVVSDKMEKTVVVAVKRSVRHPLYKKIVRRVRRFKAHNEELNAHLGDVVRIVESRPLSREKRWRVIEVLSRADLPEVAAESIDLELLGEVKAEEETPEEEAQEQAAVAAEPAEAAVSAEEPEAVAAGVEEPPAVEDAPAEPETVAAEEPVEEEETKPEEPEASAEAADEGEQPESSSEEAEKE